MGDFVVKEEQEKRTFETGAIRNSAKGKGRCDLLPAGPLLRLAVHYEKGAEIYGDRNWEKGIPINEMISSGLRHIFNYMQGERTEDHLAAAAFNILGAMFMEDKEAEQDLPNGECYLIFDNISLLHECSVCGHRHVNVPSECLKCGCHVVAKSI
jgi:hypothetical protein